MSWHGAIMIDPVERLAQDAYWVIFLVVFSEQIGLPLPSSPVLIAAGALAAAGRIDTWAAIGLSLIASLLADSLWYALGRRFGSRVLGFLCRVSIEPDSCVTSAKDGFTRHGPWLLAIAKFVPGLNTVAPPLAGFSGMGVSRFLLIDSGGMLALVLVLMGAGALIREPFERFVRWLSVAGGWAALPIAAAILVYFGWKYARRRRLLHELRMARVTPAELKAKLDAGEQVTIVDLRHALEQRGSPPALPGALRMLPQEVPTRYQEIPRDRDVVLYCT